MPPAQQTMSGDRNGLRQPGHEHDFTNYAEAGGESPCRQGCPSATGAASSPIFRARKASLVQTGCPSAPVVLDRTPPLHQWAFAPLPPKNAVRVSRKGDSSRRRPSKASVGRRRFLYRWRFAAAITRRSDRSCYCSSFTCYLKQRRIVSYSRNTVSNSIQCHTFRKQSNAIDCRQSQYSSRYITDNYCWRGLWSH